MLRITVDEKPWVLSFRRASLGGMTPLEVDMIAPRAEHHANRARFYAAARGAARRPCSTQGRTRGRLASAAATRTGHKNTGRRPRPDRQSGRNIVITTQASSEHPDPMRRKLS